MPTNLNALIRYKQIDTCLSNRYVKCTIMRLQDVCSEAIGEYRGVYKQVSERTIRDDIRVMRSDILGFNAPIKSKNGVFYYTKNDYSIFRTPVTEINLLRDILKMLIEERDNIMHFEIDKLLKRISVIVGEPLPSEKDKEKVLENILPSEEQIKPTYGSIANKKENINKKVDENKIILSSNVTSNDANDSKETIFKTKYKKISGPTDLGHIEIKIDETLLLWKEILKVV